VGGGRSDKMRVLWHRCKFLLIINIIIIYFHIKHIFNNKKYIINKLINKQILIK